MMSGFRSRKGVTKSDGGEGDRPNGRPNYFLGKYVKYALFETIYGGLRFWTSFMGESLKPDEIGRVEVGSSKIAKNTGRNLCTIPYYNFEKLQILKQLLNIYIHFDFSKNI